MKILQITFILFAVLPILCFSYCSEDVCHNTLYSKTSFKRDDDSIIFVYINDPDGTNKRGTFYPTVDDFTVLRINEFGCTYGENENVTISVGVNEDERSTFVHYSKDKRFVGYYTVIVKLDEGKIDKIFWDDSIDKSDCPDENAIDDFCSLSLEDYDDCKSNARDLKVFVAWIGTDSDGDYMTSANTIPSRFKRFGVSKVVNEAADLGEDIF
ncbi:expp1 protein [Anaeramoeba flamelloides]|uniref:Expp1 protein n=1 Tax=Anaeramoeba flamelloides TaxID=1746091 RepID=A0AAV7Y9M3_9EUKA|nr:expp1 protein [Anaeramoeba flamelloides]